MKNLFERYEVIPLATTELPGDYQRWALDFFTNPQLAPNPYVDITVQLDTQLHRRSLWKNYHMPLAAKLHHSSCDPYVFDLLLQNYLQRLQDRAVNS